MPSKNNILLNAFDIETARLFLLIDLGNIFVNSLFLKKRILPPELITLSFKQFEDGELLDHRGKTLSVTNNLAINLDRLKKHELYGSGEVGRFFLDAVANYMAPSSLRLRTLRHLKILRPLVDEKNFDEVRPDFIKFCNEADRYNFVQIFEEEYLTIIFKRFKERFSIKAENPITLNTLEEHEYIWLINEDYLLWNDAFSGLLREEFEKMGVTLTVKDSQAILAYINGNDVKLSRYYICNYLKYLPIDPETLSAKDISNKNKPYFLKNENEFDYVLGRLLNFFFYFHSSGPIEVNKLRMLLLNIQNKWNQ